MKMLMIVAAAVMLTASAAHCEWAEKKEEIHKTLGFASASAERKLVVDNINGSISVTSYAGDSIVLVCHKTLRAESDSRMEEAVKKINLEITTDPDRILLYVNAPWRCEDGSMHDRGRDYYGYDGDFDFEIKVP